MIEPFSQGGFELILIASIATIEPVLIVPFRMQAIVQVHLGSCVILWCKGWPAAALHGYSAYRTDIHVTIDFAPSTDEINTSHMVGKHNVFTPLERGTPDLPHSGIVSGTL